MAIHLRLWVAALRREWQSYSKMENERSLAGSKIESDSRVVLSLDAGGSSFRFSAVRGGRTIVELPPVAAITDDLPKCLDALVQGFKSVQDQCEQQPVAVSFAFPGPADYPRGLIGNLPNFPCFRDGVSLGPYLASRLRLPVIINNDGNLFALGEALGANGYLSYLNSIRDSEVWPEPFDCLFGVTLGTGFGGGIVFREQLINGINSGAGEAWLLRNIVDKGLPAEEGASIRAIRREYARAAGIDLSQVPSPREIAEIARDVSHPYSAAAANTFSLLGRVTGDALAQACAMLDAPVVIGGGISAASDLFMPALIKTMNTNFGEAAAGQVRRMSATAAWIDRPTECQSSSKFQEAAKATSGSGGNSFSQRPAIPVGVTRLGTTQAIVLGAYAEALRHLDAGPQAGVDCCRYME